VSTFCGPQEATWADVQAAHVASWGAMERFGLGSPESVQAYDLAAATHSSQIRHEARQAAGHDGDRYANMEAGG
jgi:hypothetical protein